MKTPVLLMVCIAIFAGACTNGTKKVETKMLSEGMETFVGNYVTPNYQKRGEGYDWVAVTVTQLTDSLAHIAIRSRADKKKPTCTFDADAVLNSSNVLKAMVEGKSILFTFSGDSLAISAENQLDEGFLNYFCSGGGSIGGTYIRVIETLDTAQIDKTKFRKSLTWNNFMFDVNLKENLLSIEPVGLEKDNCKVEHEIEGTVVNAEIGDLNGDNFPEVLVYITSPGSGSYGSVIGYSVNNGKSMSQITFPSIADNPKANKGYMGHDEFAIVENIFNHRFPIYKDGDINAKPTGGIRQIQYKLKNGENSRQLVVDKIVEY
ncbi:MAG: PliI family lysozyme inhibitor of I-type lysozyme [Bacteroidales bacterium]